MTNTLNPQASTVGAPGRVPGREAAIRVSGLGKSYRVGHKGYRPSTITEAVIERAKHPFRRAEYEEFLALDDVSFEVPWGEAVGIVGRNGAGKSTLLKLLTRVTAPSKGRVELHGRIGSLLEVGTGFHGELTGRENIFLSGSLLGMRRKEIRRQFDSIVDFSGVEKFLDTPVKRYSSGMYVRLAFAVAAHLETEILAIDEVLAVGDAEFQAKSLAKMRDVAKDGRTVLYVSHQMQTVTALCTSAIYLEHGRIGYYGTVEGALERYRKSFASFAARNADPARRPGNGELRATEVRVSEDAFEPAADKVIEIRVGDNPELLGQYFVSCHVNDENGVVVAQCDSRNVGVWLDPAAPQEIDLTIRSLWLKPGKYTVDVFVCKTGILDAWEGAAQFEVLPTSPYPELAGEEALTRGLVFADFSYDSRTERRP
ncbi:polysaccharide ABC transporter ATP-binding protein [Xylanimonas protaetiae]|uniref:ATP-binding cassette domain-containing protein n=1 Tax=Xylanimonas protaetiae TaxID=2509457 RepID=A0A4P6F0M5_9MICO|nr:polysaccharide ABC transporter ATP-binding protein [Xylanimonas protaetiae]QAY69012.1 ATP-binding cassette domain-containing protein [Xylanimonas protaetiae]